MQWESWCQNPGAQTGSGRSSLLGGKEVVAHAVVSMSLEDPTRSQTKSDAQGHQLHDSTCMSDLEPSDTQGRQVGRWCPGPGGEGQEALLRSGPRAALWAEEGRLGWVARAAAQQRGAVMLAQSG